MEVRCVWCLLCLPPLGWVETEPPLVLMNGLSLMKMMTVSPLPLCSKAAGGRVSADRCVWCTSGAAGAGGAGSGGEQETEGGVWCSAAAPEQGGVEAQGGEGSRRAPAGGHDVPEEAGCCPHEPPQQTPVQVSETQHACLLHLFNSPVYLFTIPV